MPVERFAPSPSAQDLVLSEIQGGCRLLPQTVLGLLWIQTHFEASTWDLVCSGEVRISLPSSHALRRDAIAAGLQVLWVPIETAQPHVQGP